jgi:type I restriction-modification system DNA methylase subunit
VVVPTRFLTEGKGKSTNIANKIRKLLIDKEWLRAVVIMPSKIFATIGTNVSIMFIKMHVFNHRLSDMFNKFAELETIIKSGI